MKKSRYLNTGIAVVAIAVVAWAICNFATLEAPARADDSQEASDNCKGCQSLKVVVSDDPTERRAQFELFEQEQATRNAQIAKEALRESLKWKGSRFVPSAGEDALEEYSSQKHAAELLSANMTVPESRTSFFESYLSSEGVRHVGWEGRIADVADLQDETMVELHVRPSLVTVNGRAAFVARCMHEIWRIDSAGRVSFVKAEGGEGVGVIIVD